MFGRGEKYVLPVMDLYPKEVIREIDECFTGQRPSYIVRAPFTTMNAISIDKITMRKNPTNGEVYLRVDNSATGEYMKSWKKGLGRFILSDFKKNENSKNYALVRYTSSDKSKKMAFVRFITKEEASEPDDMKAYGAISGELTSWVEVSNPFNEDGSPMKSCKDTSTYSFEVETLYVVLKVVPWAPSVKPEEVVAIPYLINKDRKNDNVWVIETDPFETEVVKAAGSRVDEEPDIESLNPPEDTLF